MKGYKGEETQRKASSPEKNESARFKRLIATYQTENENLQAQLTDAKKIINDLKSGRPSPNNSKKKNDKFDQVKKAFARKYHPNNIQSDGIDKLVREEIFKEFWKELQKIDADK